ncbi:uncharacterized protein LOC116841042 [Odontomachus brunneus]|uniref:uncharacterized protein LOC116841042 n=1 Tax=Odontomachus brunneus TaxID=486640 RepID=UPI0013F193D1|nr:uncharacterized protein LOC116841042 [Odontomachus brunneus]
MAENTQFRPMKYPYTFVAKMAQFPYKYYWTHSWMYRYMFYSLFITLPVFYKIQKLSYSPENVKIWEKKWKESFEGTGHH